MKRLFRRRGEESVRKFLDDKLDKILLEPNIEADCEAYQRCLNLLRKKKSLRLDMYMWKFIDTLNARKALGREMGTPYTPNNDESDKTTSRD